MRVYKCDGKLQGVTIPAWNAMLGKWAPPMERSIMGTITITGKEVIIKVKMIQPLRVTDVVAKGIVYCQWPNFYLGRFVYKKSQGRCHWYMVNQVSALPLFYEDGDMPISSHI